MASYPNLKQIINDLALDNYGYEMPEIDWTRFDALQSSGVDLKELERQAASLSRDEQLVIACGEHSERVALEDGKQVKLLSEFIDRVFEPDAYEDPETCRFF